jgi:hypothetical protein
VWHLCGFETSDSFGYITVGCRGAGGGSRTP